MPPCRDRSVFYKNKKPVLHEQDGAFISKTTYPYDYMLLSDGERPSRHTHISCARLGRDPRKISFIGSHHTRFAANYLFPTVFVIAFGFI